MISPLGQRQTLQTVAVEAVRQAMEGGAQVQREQARRQAFDAKLVEAMSDVGEVQESDVLRLADHEGRDNRQEQGTGHTGEAEDEEPPASPAEGAGPHLDLLA